MAMSTAEIQAKHPDLGASLGPHDQLIRISIIMGDRGLGIGLDEDMQVVGWRLQATREHTIFPHTAAPHSPMVPPPLSGH